FAAVEREGDAAVARYAAAFDRSSLAADALQLPLSAAKAAWDATTPELRAAITTAIDQVTAYQQRLLPQGFGEDLSEALGVRWLPLDSVGAYVPGGAGGSLPLPSTVIMNLIPAKVAGVRDLVLATPARPDGTIASELLAAAHAVGVTRILRVGGIPAIAALACGTATLPAVAKIVGPGNIVVTLAKRHAYGLVDLDMLAGARELLVICDPTANPAHVAADLQPQAEHDVLAMGICLTIGAGPVAAIERAVTEQLAQLPDERRRVAEESIARHGRCIPC